MLRKSFVICKWDKSLWEKNIFPKKKKEKRKKILTFMGRIWFFIYSSLNRYSSIQKRVSKEKLALCRRKFKERHTHTHMVSVRNALWSYSLESAVLEPKKAENLVAIDSEPQRNCWPTATFFYCTDAVNTFLRWNHLTVCPEKSLTMMFKGQKSGEARF